MLRGVPHVDMVEETFLAVTPAAVAAAVRDPEFTAALWPDLELTVFADRGDTGLRWAATGALVGSCEVWLEPHGDGVLAHTYLRADVTAPSGPTAPVALSARRSQAEQQRRARHAKQVWWALKDRLEAGRLPGEPAVG
jgi:hypothetical protein